MGGINFWGSSKHDDVSDVTNLQSSLVTLSSSLSSMLLSYIVPLPFTRHISYKHKFRTTCCVTELYVVFQNYMLCYITVCCVAELPVVLRNYVLCYIIMCCVT